MKTNLYLEQQLYNHQQWNIYYCNYNKAVGGNNNNT